MDTSAGRIAVISGRLTGGDVLGGWKARWGIGRMSYIVPPGLYAIGEPDREAPVVVTANYKMSYDLVRSTLEVRNIWLLVLETFGINVWCAAGKGTFGTGELVRRVGSSGLERLVSHRRLLLPIMGAAGVKGVEVAKRTGFEVRFATLRIKDLPAYLDNGLQATGEMRQLTFCLRERLALIPIELVGAMKSLPCAGIPLALLAAFPSGNFSPERFLAAFLLYAVAVVCGTVATPLLLPLLPGRMFAVKGALAGSACFLVSALSVNCIAPVAGLDLAAMFLLMVAVSAFYAMNFTGSTPFTSPSGVRREMQRSLPLMASSAVAGLVLLLIRVVRP
jgi:acetyl-CoA decarbonylase/synthase complex subunit gamma